jgi:hypothetical protein
MKHREVTMGIPCRNRTGGSSGLLLRVALTALLVTASMLLVASCGEQSMEVTTTTERVDLDQSMYDKIEMGMSYQDVVDIVGQDPNRAEEVPDEVRETGKVLKCTWEGTPGTGEYQGESLLEVSFYEGEACEIGGTNL